MIFVIWSTWNFYYPHAENILNQEKVIIGTQLTNPGRYNTQTMGPSEKQDDHDDHVTWRKMHNLRSTNAEDFGSDVRLFYTIRLQPSWSIDIYVRHNS